MMLTLLIFQVLLTQVLNQVHQELRAQLSYLSHDLPLRSDLLVAQCLAGQCPPQVEDFQVYFLTQIQERQFFNAELKFCDFGKCSRISQVFSEGSAILKERGFHAITVEAQVET